MKRACDDRRKEGRRPEGVHGSRAYHAQADEHPNGHHETWAETARRGNSVRRVLHVSSDQVIRGPASRGTETSAEGLVGPPGRMVSNAGQSTAVEQ